jgi:hypothetical protein
MLGRAASEQLVEVDVKSREDDDVEHGTKSVRCSWLMPLLALNLYIVVATPIFDEHLLNFTQAHDSSSSYCKTYRDSLTNEPLFAFTPHEVVSTTTSIMIKLPKAESFKGFQTVAGL